MWIEFRSQTSNLDFNLTSSYTFLYFVKKEGIFWGIIEGKFVKPEKKSCPRRWYRGPRRRVGSPVSPACQTSLRSNTLYPDWEIQTNSMWEGYRVDLVVDQALIHSVDEGQDPPERYLSAVLHQEYHGQRLVVDPLASSRWVNLAPLIPAGHSLRFHIFTPVFQKESKCTTQMTRPRQDYQYLVSYLFPFSI